MDDTKRLIIFLTIAISIYTLWNLYVYFKGKLALQPGGSGLMVYRILFILLALMIPLSYFIRHSPLSGVAVVVTYVGFFWFGAIFYFIQIGIFADLMRLVNHFFPFVPPVFKENRVIVGRVAFMLSVIGVAVVLCLGWFHAKDVKVREIEIELKNMPVKTDSLSIVFFADNHLGMLVDEGQLETIVREVNGLNPDIILIGGDLMDEGADFLASMVDVLSDLKARYGIYAILGNHEFYNGMEESAAFMEEAGITVLRDSVVAIDGIVNIVGLDDPTIHNSRGIDTIEALKGMLEVRDKDLPTILIYHTPIHVEEISGSGIDLMLSGHTHDGQLFPNNFLVSMMYTVSCGYEKIGDMHIYVTSGAGTWGAPVRVGTDSEIVKITLVGGGGEALKE